MLIGLLTQAQVRFMMFVFKAAIVRKGAVPMNSL